MVGHKQAFTLLELFAVMAVIAILAALGVKGSAYARQAAKAGRAKADIEKLRTALNEYRVQRDGYPLQPQAAPFNSLDELDTLTNHVGGIQLVDPWGRPYQYHSSYHFQYRVWSEGENPDLPEDNIDPSKPGY